MSTLTSKEKVRHIFIPTFSIVYCCCFLFIALVRISLQESKKKKDFGGKNDTDFDFE